MELQEKRTPLSAEQKAVFERMEKTSQHMFITGYAGTGKSFLLKYFKEHTKKRGAIVAPTGIAALNVRGQTIHSFFRIAPGLQRQGELPRNSRVCSLLKRLQYLIIDEISMVRADLLDAINERMQEAFNNTLPFGGVQLLMFGDIYQLPPILEDGLAQYFEYMYGGYFFFNALVWQHTTCEMHELTEVFRQKDDDFKALLNAVRDGSIVDHQLQQLNVRCGIPVPDDGTVTLAATNALVTTINQRRLDALPGKSYTYQATITGEMKRPTFPTEEVIELKVGAQVILLQNDKEGRWVNGTIATIASLKKASKNTSFVSFSSVKEKAPSEDKISVLVDGEEYELEQVTWEEIRYEYDPVEGKVREEVISSFTQYPIRLAWALTIHKSQGQTYESVALDLSASTFAPGQLYVALSRCTSLEGLYLKKPIKKSHIIIEPKIREFMAQEELA